MKKYGVGTEILETEVSNIRIIQTSPVFSVSESLTGEFLRERLTGKRSHQKNLQTFKKSFNFYTNQKRYGKISEKVC